MMKRKLVWLIVGIIIVIILALYSYPYLKESFTKTSTNTDTEESIDIEKVIYSSYNYAESPILIGYVEEKDEVVYEGELERKSYTYEKPGAIRIIYEGILYLSDERDIQPGIYWIEIKLKQIVEDIDDPPMEKEVVIKFEDRFYKGNLEIDLAKGSIYGNEFYYYGKLYYDDSLGEEDITE